MSKNEKTDDVKKLSKIDDVSSDVGSRFVGLTINKRNGVADDFGFVLNGDIGKILAKRLKVDAEFRSIVRREQARAFERVLSLFGDESGIVEVDGCFKGYVGLVAKEQLEKQANKKYAKGKSTTQQGAK